MTFPFGQLDFALLKFPSVSVVSDIFLYFLQLLWHNEISLSDMPLAVTESILMPMV